MRLRQHLVRLYDDPREARPLPEYASLYPRLKAGRWYPVRRLLDRLRHSLSMDLREALDSHFELRGGLGPRNAAWPYLRQRRDDVPVAAPGAGERQGRLLRSFARLYRPISAEQWLPARHLRDEVVELREEEMLSLPAWKREGARAGRALPDDHFEFRMGMSDPGMPRLRTRREDPAFRKSVKGP